MKNLITILAMISTLSFTGLAHAGEKGNGGDFIRQVFIERGKQIVSFLEKRESRISFFRSNGVSPRALRNVLRIEVITVSSDPLTDNRGSAVDALGSVGKIVLDQSAWRTYIIKGVTLDRMILHEALRAIGKNDDNYVISGKAPEIPSSYDKNRVSAGYRVLREEFAESRFPTADELRALSEGGSLRCEEYLWDESSPNLMSARLQLWHEKVAQFYWYADHFWRDIPDALYVDSELQSVSGFISGEGAHGNAGFGGWGWYDGQVNQVFLRTLSGKEFIAEISDSRDTKSPTAVSNRSLRANRYRICQQQ
jgi:hypothetical protein